MAKFTLSLEEKAVLRKCFERILNAEAHGFVFFCVAIKENDLDSTLSVICPKVNPDALKDLFVLAADAATSKGKGNDRPAALFEYAERGDKKWQ